MDLLLTVRERTNAECVRVVVKQAILVQHARSRERGGQEDSDIPYDYTGTHARS